MTIAAPPQSYSIGNQSRSMMQSIGRFFFNWTVDDLNSASQSTALEETRLPRLLTLSMLTLSAATFAFIGWAAVTPVKELARAEGQVLPSGYTQLVQHLEGGLVRKILVQEGDFVQKGQLLVEMDGAGLQEDFHEQDALVASLSLQRERLHALLENRTPDFSGIGATEEEIAQQQRMLETTRHSQASDLAVIGEQIAEKKASIPRLQQALVTSQQNLELARQSRDIYAKLDAKGLSAHTAYLKKLEEFNTRQGEVNTGRQQITQAQSEISEFQHRHEALIGQQRDNAYTELSKVETDLAQAKQVLQKRSERVKRLDVRAPVMGYVKGLKVNTIGSVVPAGQTLMEIVPVDEQLVVEARILPTQIGRVAPGQNVQVKVDSFDYVRFGSIPGKLESISAMTFSDETKRQDYYKGRVVLSRNYAGTLPGTNLVIPGMTADADIVTGEKTVLSYLLKPIQIALSNAMTEQ